MTLIHILRPVDLNRPDAVFDTSVDPDLLGANPGREFHFGHMRRRDTDAYEIMVTDVNRQPVCRFLERRAADGSGEDCEWRSARLLPPPGDIFRGVQTRGRD